MLNFINVPVPERLVGEVMALIAARWAGAANAADSIRPPGAATHADWGEVELRKLWGESGKPMRAALRLMTAHGGNPVSGDEIAKALGKKERGHTVSGMMGALGRRLKHRHNGRRPFSAKWNAAEASWEYTMPATVARALAKVIAADAAK